MTRTTTASSSSSCSSSGLSASLALCLLLLQSIPLTAVGHLRHRHHHNHDHSHDGDQHYDHDHPTHRRTDSLESDFSPHHAAGNNSHADIFESCLVACYEDIVDRYGVKFAEQLKADGFTYEECENDNSTTTTTTASGYNPHNNNNSTNSDQQRALHRLLGATNQLHRLWTIPSHLRTSDGKLHIPYAIKSNTAWFNSETLSTIQLALEHIEQSTGVIQFVQRTDQVEYIYFNHEVHYEGVCAANLGKQTGRQTNVYLGWCKGRRHLGNIVHELLHALGFWHEHSRPDRDDHVTIHWNNIRESSKNNFQKAFMVNSLGSPYDFNSIMHYPPVSFSTNRLPTIVPVIPLANWETMGQRSKLSERDVEQLRLLYQCKSGPRMGDISVDELCSTDCPCWEHAMGECHGNNNECMGNLICGTTPNPLPTLVEYKDQMPYYASNVGSFSCNEYCHVNCCGYSNSKIKCPQSCDSAPPVVVPDVIPERMCVARSDAGGGGRGGSGGTSATGATVATTTSTQTTTTKATTAPKNYAPWYVKWSIDKCVQHCIGPAPCGGMPETVSQYHGSVQSCCSKWLHYKSFQDCHTMPEEGSHSETGGPTRSPTEGPSTTSTMPTDAPTWMPTDATNTPSSTTWSPSKSPSRSPTQGPTPLPTNAPGTESPTSSPTVEPSSAPTTSEEPTMVPTTDTPTSAPSANPTNEPTTEQPSHSPTTQSTEVPSQSPTKQPSESPVVTTTTTTTIATVAAVPSSGDWYIDWDLSKCVRDCVGERPCRKRRKDKWEAGHATVQGCCNTMSSYVPFEECSYDLSIEKRAGSQPTTSDTKWYPSKKKCKNDDNAPSWQNNKYTSQSTCCTSHFNWDYNNCMGITPAASHKWYMSWAIGKCVKDCEKGGSGSCGGLVTGSWILIHDSANACCSAHMSYTTVSQCKYNG